MACAVSATFREDSASVARQIQASFDRGEAEAVERAAHKLKGSSGTMAAREVAGLCGRIETLASNDKLSEAGPLIARLPHALERLERALAAVAAG